MPTQADVNYVQAAVKARWVDAEKASDALRALKQMEDLGGKGSIAEIFVKKGYLSREQADNLSNALGLIQQAAPAVKKVGDFQLLRRIGAGGMGAVYLAKHANGTVVALKTLPSHLAEDPEYLARFQREAAIAHQLDHPNIVRCLAAGEAGGHHYIALEYIEGGSVMDRLKGNKPLPEVEALSILSGVCQGLQYAHERGVVHRDIKPANILLTKDGTDAIAKITDLGLARASGDLKITQTGVTLGTPHYMSPEQAEGQKDLDIRSDLYSLGATLYHMACGEPPFQGDTALVVIHQHLEVQLPSPAEKNPLLSGGICHIIEKAMAKKPGDRYQTPSELLEDALTVAAGGSPKSEPVAAGQSTVRPRAISTEVARKYRESRRGAKTGSRASLVIGVAAVVVIAVGIVLAVRSQGRETPGARPWETEPGTSVTGGEISQPLTDVRGSVPAGPRPSETNPAGARPWETEPGTSVTGGEISQPLTDVRGSVQVAAMLRAAEQYAVAHPEDFQEIVDRFETTQKRAEGTEYEFKAKDAAKAWRGKWEARAKEEIEKRRLSSEALTNDSRFDQARKVWDEFPKSLLTEGIGSLVEEEKRKLDERAGRLADELSSLAGPLLAKEPGNLTAADVKALTTAMARAEAASYILEGAQKKALAELVKKIDAVLEAFKQANASERAKAFDEFWDRFVKRVKERKFEEAESLVAKEEGDQAGRLRGDLRLLKGLFARAEANLGQLVGKTVRMAGLSLKATAVREGKLILKQGEAEMAMGAERLDADDLAKVAFLGEMETKEAAYEEALFHFYFGRPAKTKAALAKAKEHGAEVAFYEERLLELDQGLEKARAERDALALVGQADSALKAGKVETAESRTDKLEKEFGQTDAAKANLTRLQEALADAQGNAAAKKNLVFVPGGMFVYQDGQEIDVPAFYIGKYEVSNADYAEFVAWMKKETEKGLEVDVHPYCYPGYLADGKELSEDQLEALEKMSLEKRLAAIKKLGLKGGEPPGKGHDAGGPANHPVVNVDWYDAWAYCRWRGGRLPTEVEWEKAASWDPKLKRKHVYPYGDTFLEKFCNTSEAGDGFDGLCPVDEFPKGASSYGCLNMAGNVWEYCYSWYEHGKFRVLRGGSCLCRSDSARCAYRGGHIPGTRSDGNGFRVLVVVSRADRP